MFASTPGNVCDWEVQKIGCTFSKKYGQYHKINRKLKIVTLSVHIYILFLHVEIVPIPIYV